MTQVKFNSNTVWVRWDRKDYRETEFRQAYSSRIEFMRNKNAWNLLLAVIYENFEWIARIVDGERLKQKNYWRGWVIVFGSVPLAINDKTEQRYVLGSRVRRIQHSAA